MTTTQQSASSSGAQRKYAGKDAQTRQAERRRKLVEAGMTLFGRYGFAATSIDAICAEAGLTKRYFYESFSSSEELLTETYRAATQELLDALLKVAAPHLNDSHALVQAGVEEVFRFVQAQPNKARLIMIEATSVRSQLGRVYGKSYGAFVELLVNFTKPFLPKDGPSDTILAVMARGAVGAIIHRARPGWPMIASNPWRNWWTACSGSSAAWGVSWACQAGWIEPNAAVSCPFTCPGELESTVMMK